MEIDTEGAETVRQVKTLRSQGQGRDETERGSTTQAEISVLKVTGPIQSKTQVLISDSLLPKSRAGKFRGESAFLIRPLMTSPAPRVSSVPARLQL